MAIEKFKINFHTSVGGPIALVRDGDLVTIDVDACRLDVDAPLEERRRSFQPRRRKPLRGAMAKYARLVSSAARGAVTILAS